MQQVAWFVDAFHNVAQECSVCLLPCPSFFVRQPVFIEEDFEEARKKEFHVDTLHYRPRLFNYCCCHLL